MRTIEELRTLLGSHLRAHGLSAVTAWEDTPRTRPDKAVAAVSLRSMESGPPGFQNYLGERYDEQTGQWLEIYGKKVELHFGLALYAASATQVQRGLDRLTDALQEGPGGLQPLGFSAGETVYKSDMKRYFCPVEARFGAWAVAVTREDGSFLDFEVKGDFQP